MDRHTRKELKTDRFVQEVEHTVAYVSGHRKQFIRYGAVAGAVLVIALVAMAYMRYQKSARQDELRAVIEIQEAIVGPTPNEFALSFATAEEKQKAVTKALTDLHQKRSGTDEGAIAAYYLGVNAADAGKLDEAEKHFKEAAASKDRAYASLAEFALSQVYRGQGKTAEAEKVLRALMANPTILVSKEQATISLAEVIARTNPAEARNLLVPLRTERSAISRAALNALGGIPSN
jgi:predicted negative regulator of RcsB-dependent stress response